MSGDGETNACNKASARRKYQNAAYQVGHLDAWRDPQISLSDYHNRKGIKKETVAKVLGAE
jgi:hypothetical protein